MGVWLVDADVLARSRFRLSPFAETVGILLVLLGTGPTPGQLTDVAVLRAAFRDRLARDPVEAAFARSAVVPLWIADFLCTPPGDDERDFADEVRRLRRTPDEVLLADLAACLGGRNRPVCVSPAWPTASPSCSPGSGRQPCGRAGRAERRPSRPTSWRAPAA